MKRLIILFLPFIILSCGEPKVDASTEESMKSSVENISNNLSEEKKEEFGKAIMTIAMSNLDFSNAFQGNFDTEPNSQKILSKVRDQIDNKTANQIIKIADSIRQDRERKQVLVKQRLDSIKQAQERERRLQALKEIEELEQKQKETQIDRAKLSNFKVLDSKFYIQEGDVFSSKPVIELTVVNNTDYAISRAYFKGTYASPDRQVPWFEGTFNYKISGGVEPGEKHNWTLAPNPYGDWGDIEEKSDAILTVEPLRIDGPDGELLFDSEGLSDYEKERLEELKQEYPAN